jgi:hypothetical protein
MRIILLLLLGGLLTWSTGCGHEKVREAAARSGKSSPEGPDLGRDWDGGPHASSDKAPTKSSPGDAPKSPPSIDTDGSATTVSPDPKLAPLTPPAVAEAVAGTVKSPSKAKKDQPLPPKGILTAGSFDDNLDPPVFQAFVKKMMQIPDLVDLPGKMGGQRLMVLVKDSAGKPVGQARVKLSHGANSVEITTRSDGRAVFLLTFDEFPADQALSALITPPEGGPTITEKIVPGAPRWDITLPDVQARLPKNLDLAIVLDTTGSMGDELKYLQSEIRGISATIQEKFPDVHQRFALILYRDEGDDYVVRPFDFTSSLEEFHKKLVAQSTNGGGDYPEAMHKGLEEANQLRWREKDTARVLFLVGDAPPHVQHMNRTMVAANNLRQKGIAIYPMACSGYNDSCEFVMRSCALMTGSQFLFLTDDSGVGSSHAEPKIPYYSVEKLDRLVVRMLSSELSGQRIDPNPAEIIRSVGSKRGN